MVETRFPLSFAQERLWFLDQLAPGDPTYLVATTLPLTHLLDPAALQVALDRVVARHESLRTRFVHEDGRPVQCVADRLRVPLHVHDLRDVPESLRDAERHRLSAAASLTPFDLGELPLVRMTLIISSDTSALLSLTMHHIVADGWSLGIFFRDLNAYLAGTQHTLPPLEIGYPDFAAWQRERLDLPAMQGELDWWARTLSEAAVLDLPTDRPRRPDVSGAAGRAVFEIPPEVAVPLLARGRRHGCTTYMTLLAAFATLLGRYADQNDVVLGTYTAGRDRTELEPLVGFFVNAVAMRVDLTGSPTFPQLLARVRETVLDAFAHQDLPFASIVERVAPDRETSRNPFFDVVFHLYNVPGAEVGAQAADEPGAAPLDLVCSMWASGDALYGHLDYRRALFDAETVDALLRAFHTVLGHLADGSNEPLEQLDLLSAADWRAEVVTANETDRADPADGVTEIFDRQAAATPEAIAFDHDGSALTYRGLHSAAHDLAARLQCIGAGPERVVGLHLRRGLDLPIALLAVLYTGAAFLPLDPGQPPERLAGMIADAQAIAVVSDAPTVPASVPVVRVAGRVGVAAGTGPAFAPCRSRADDLAYVIFTSGSTGRPKGVAVEHRQLLNRLAWMWEEYPFAPGEVACQKTSIGFVDVIWEVLGALLRGVATVILTDAQVGDPQLMVDVLGAGAVSRIWLVPSLLRELLDAVPDLADRAPALRFWVASGEPLPRTLAARFRAQLPEARLYNLYGTSEVWDATWHDDADDDADAGQVPIGRPISNVQAYVVDSELRPLPQGAVGELVIGGHGVARGYLTGPSPAFGPDPFRAGGRLNRTGDLARRRADGTLELLGRRDLQVKLRGFRVEPGEVEAVLLGCPGVRDAVVTVRPGPQEQPILVAYLTGPAELSIVRAFAAERLPEHLRPARLHRLDALPTTASGKVDRARLPDLVDERVAGRQPETALEQLVAYVWRAVLERDDIGADDDFFADLGGHSLLGMRVIARLRRLLGAQLPVRRLFEAPTVARLAAVIEDELGAELAEQTADIVLRVAAMTEAEAETELAHVQGKP